MKDKKDVIKIDVPTLIRLFEYFSETDLSDVDLHFIVENIISVSKRKDVIDMNDYENIVKINNNNKEDLRLELREENNLSDLLNKIKKEVI